MALLALFGSLARGKNWQDPVTGKILKTKCISEVATAVMIAVLAVAGGVYLHVSLIYVSAFSVLGGWLGPEAVSKLVMDKFKVGVN